MEYSTETQLSNHWIVQYVKQQMQNGKKKTVRKEH